MHIKVIKDLLATGGVLEVDILELDFAVYDFFMDCIG